MSRLNVGNLFNENEDGAPVVSGISTFSSPHYFVPPSGSTAQRPLNPGEGMIRFNTDSGHLEYYTGTHWADVITNNNELGDQNNTNSSGGTGTRGVFSGGQRPSAVNTIDYITISTLGNAQDFGDLYSTGTSVNGSSSSRTRGIIHANYNGLVNTNIIQFITISSTGNSQDFGDTSVARRSNTGASNQTRGLIVGGYTNTHVNVIDYITIAQTGDAVDFGDLTTARYGSGGVSSSVRACFGGGGPNQTTIDYVTISSTGNAQDFGDRTTNHAQVTGCSSSTRGLFAGGYNPSLTDIIDFITISSTGNAQDFGNLTAITTRAGGTSSPIRGIFAGGSATSPGNNVDKIDFVTIATTGNALDFGDLSQSREFPASVSNGHGGL